jgi:DNA-binding NarL/FixJ family response regulator
MTRVLVVDDHPIVRRGIVDVLSGAIPNSFVGQASTASEALSAIWGDNWNLVVLDISLPGKNGLEVLKEIKAARPRLPVLVLSGFPESQFAPRMLKAGASGYLTKEAPPETLIQAVRRTIAGGKYVSPEVADRLISDLSADTSRPPHEQLSDREYDVMLRLASGKSVGQVAEELNLSVKTISTYRSRLLEKMRMANNAELTQYAIRAGLLE